MGGVDFTAAYEDRAIYLPSLQQGYAAFAQRAQRSLKPNEVPKGFQFGDLNYLKGTSIFRRFPLFRGNMPA